MRRDRGDLADMLSLRHLVPAVMPLFLVPDDFRAFMRSVVTELDAPGPGGRIDPRSEPIEEGAIGSTGGAVAGHSRVIDVEDAFRDHCGYGGRVDGMFRFHYLTPDATQRWTIVLAEHEVRAIADGLQIEAEAEPSEIGHGHRRAPSGAPLLIWGAYNDDALTVRSFDELAGALETLRLAAQREPRVLRVWSPSDDQLVAVVWRDHSALYVIEAADGYATSTGDPRRTDGFEVLDHDGNPLIVPWADCVPWPAACRALTGFAAHGELGPEIPIEHRIPSQLLMHGELDRQTVLAMRAEPARELARSSLPRLSSQPVTAAVSDFAEATDVTVPVLRLPLGAAELAAWARRLIQLVFARGLIELDAAPGLDEISDQLSGLLAAHGDEAEHSSETAEWLVNEIRAIRGIRTLFATGGDLQLALRRSREP